MPTEMPIDRKISSRGSDSKPILTIRDVRKANIDKLQRNAGFMEEWLRKGIEDWKKNMLIKKERERKTLEFEYTQAEKYKASTMRQVQKGTMEVTDGIDDFENTLRKEGIKPHIDSDEEEGLETVQ